MAYTRIIPRLDIKGPNVVKGIHLEGLRVLGKPEEFAQYYYENGADELIYMDVVASLYGRNSLLDIISLTAKKIFIPLTVGGGLRTLEDIQSVLRAGCDKVSLNTAAIQNPQFIRDASRKFGSSTIVVTIEAIKQSDGRYLAYTDNGREHTGLEVIEWARRVQDLGAGEVLITSVDQEGTGLGYNLELTKTVADLLEIPVIASGGAGCLHHVYEVIDEGHADAVAVASLLHYELVSKMTKGEDLDEKYMQEGNVEFLKTRKNFSKIDSVSLGKLKEYLIENKLMVRPN